MRQTLAKLWSGVLIISAFLSLAAFQNCGSTNTSGTGNTNLSQISPITIKATVSKSSIDGCQYLLVVTDTTTGQIQNYVPLKMDSTLLQDGNVVTVSGTLATSTVGTCMAGLMLQVEEAQLVTSH
jgi:hypothetical protein